MSENHIEPLQCRKHFHTRPDEVRISNDFLPYFVEILSLAMHNEEPVLLWIVDNLMRALVLSAYMKARTNLVATPSSQICPTEDGWSFGDGPLSILLTCYGGLDQLPYPSHSRKNPWLVSQAGLVSLQDTIRQAPSWTPCAYLRSLQFSNCPFQTGHVGFKVNSHALREARGLSKCKPRLTIEAVPP